MALPLLGAAAIAGGASLVGGAIQGYGNYKGSQAMARSQAEQARANREFAQRMYDQQYGPGSYEATTQGMGQEALGNLNQLINSGELYRPFGDYQGQLEFDPSSVDVTQDPGYAFRLQQGQRALDTGAGARGQLFSGAQQKALMDYGQNLGSQEYQNAYNRQFTTFQDARGAKYNDYLTRLGQYNQNLRNQVGDLGNLAGYGERSLGRQGGAVQGLVNSVTGANTALGNAQGAGAAAPWGLLSNVAGGVGNAVGDAMNMYALGGGFNQPSGSINPTDIASAPMPQATGIPQQMQMSGYVPSPSVQAGGQMTGYTPSNAPWKRGI